MSYCRFSDDCDVSAYEDSRGGWTTTVGGQTFNDKTLREFRDRMRALADAGFRFPDEVLDDIDKEITAAEIDPPPRPITVISPDPNDLFPDLEPPEGFVYEWKVVAVMGAGVDQSTLDDYERAGWQPVPQSWHPMTPVETRGCRLMVREKAQHDEWRNKALIVAVDQQRGMTARSSPYQKDAPYILTNWGWVPTPLWRNMETLHEDLDRLKSQLWQMIEEGE